MRRSLAACVALLLGCTRTPESDPGKTKEAPAGPTQEAPAAPKAPATPEKPEAPAPVPTPPAPVPSEPAPPAEPAALQPATVALLDRLAPVTERVVVDEAAAKALKIEVIQHELWVTQGSRRAPLRLPASAVTGVSVESAEGKEPVLQVDYEYDAGCSEEPRHVELSARRLLAQLENAAAMKPHEKRDYEASARGFARAAQLDPSLDVAWINLACALARLLDEASAMAALDPMLRRAPIYTYHKVLSDPELASLREQPAIMALRAPKPGNAVIRTLTMAHSAHLGLVAMRRVESSWGACNYTEDLRLAVAATGEPVLTLPLIEWDETNPECDEGGTASTVLPGARREVSVRLETAERFLQDMGFSVSGELELVDLREVAPEERPVTTAKLTRAGLELVVEEKAVLVRKGSEVLVTKPQNEAQGISRAGYDPAARVAFIEWYHEVPEGCDEETDGTGFIVLPLPIAP